MSNENEKKPLSVSPRGKLELKKTSESGQVRQSFSHGRSKAVAVERKKKRSFAPSSGMSSTPGTQTQTSVTASAEVSQGGGVGTLTREEREHRLRALRRSEEQRRNEGEDYTVQSDDGSSAYADLGEGRDRPKRMCPRIGPSQNRRLTLCRLTGRRLRASRRHP